MSSEVYDTGIVAPVVSLSAAAVMGVALGPFWLAWQGGKLAVELGSTLITDIEHNLDEKKRRLNKIEAYRKNSAIKTHNELLDMCSQTLNQLNELQHSAELEQLRVELNSIIHEKIPDDVKKIEELTASGFSKLKRLNEKKQFFENIKIVEKSTGLYRALSDAMHEMSIFISAQEIRATNGTNVVAPDLEVLERVKLNEKLYEVTEQILNALNYVEKLGAQFTLSSSHKAWYKSCFSGVNNQLEFLYKSSTKNSELKKGVQKLEDILVRYNSMKHHIEKEVLLYKTYADAANALGEPIESFDSFKNSFELEDKLLFLKKRSEKAQKCAKIYNKLGHSAYICYAWDQELKALGYTTYSQKDIEKMVNYKPQYAQVGENEIPFYNWTKKDLTQLYSMSEECSLQLIIHDDGSVTMKAVSDTDDNQTKETQKHHCSLLNKLHENLRKNWFVLYDYQETKSPDEITSVAEWIYSEDSAWKTNVKENQKVVKGRKKENKGKKYQYMNNRGE